jgi:hypothetical protein
MGIKTSYVVKLGGQSGPVTVETWTLKGKDLSNGYEVRYTPSAHPDRTPKSFNGISSPTREPAIAPGEYLMWSYMNGDAGEQKLVDIGKNGEPGAKVEVQVPIKHR